MSTIFNPKLFTMLKDGISKEQIYSDVIAGTIVGIVALPLAIAFAVASGVSPEKGIITAVIAGIIISALGGSKVQIGGPTGAFIVIVFAIVEQYGIDGLLISTIMAGIILIFFGLFKLGNLLRYFPEPLIVGFTSGIALVIFSTQIKDALGLDIDHVPSDFFEKWATYLHHMHEVNPYALAITAATILITVYFKYINKKIPGSFVAIILLTLLVQIFDVPVTTIGTFFSSISSEITFAIPDFQLSDLGTYLVPAFTIAILGGVESLLSAVVADGMIGGKHRSNTELIAQGIANITTPFLGGIPATGAIARTATNVKNGGRTPIAGIVHALVLLLIMLFFINYAKLIPMSILAGILIVVSFNMSEYRSFISILKGSPYDYIILVTTFILTVLVDLTFAIEVGIVLASLLFMHRMANIDGNKMIKSDDEDDIENYETLPKGISVYEIGGPVFFASAKQYAQQLQTIGIQSQVLIIRMRYVSFIDSTALHNFKETIKLLRESGISVLTSGTNDDVFKELKHHGVVELIEESNMHKTYQRAVAQARELLSKEA
ncbi:SulP family inorganic anion transporter [Sulfurovum sp.]|jgi:SulP family sulfate permease|uniref:SulP family inorganic anion transporter n=1 Tax=Sulfurovum sp. TaxID=1969726 RepID=UPI002A361771|nr:SulP family inorganic anion transporter [Sulfurovum sp.]MDD2451598.1 SulP family inorganic anion transporter [Sulfurovum sp.]MDD3499504.1 SulP family inorganic anion transporter [Sulfurovum sp.]MDY0402321.1 SulP family inorganic anion transporter [Sulfurovum sp.]